MQQFYFRKFVSKLLKRTIVCSFLFFIISDANATVTITKPSLAINTCNVYPTDYHTLGNIVITEPNGGKGDFSAGTNVTLILTAPTNFEFLAGTGDVSFDATGNMTAASIAVTSSTITITYSVTGTNAVDIMTIANIQIRATAASTAVNITRTSGTGTIAGLVNTTTVTTSLTCTTVNSLTVGSTASTTVSAATDTVCVGVSCTLYLSGSTDVSSYQWESSTNNSTFTDIAGATSSTYVYTPATATTLYFRCRLAACGASPSASSVSLRVPSRVCDCNTGGCNATTVTVNLTSKADTIYTYSSSRNGTCCGISGTRCIKFNVTTNTQTTEIGFNAVPAPSGNGQYSINCSKSVSIGTPACVSGQNSFCIVYCKSGGETGDYTISASKGFTVTSSVNSSIRCPGTLSVTGLTNVTWNSVYPGASGAYNGRLSALTGNSVTMTPASGDPSTIKYYACGQKAGCTSGSVCDTITVHVASSLTATLTPTNPVVCSGNSVTLTSSASGGTTPYTYSWSNGATTSAISVTATGTYTVSVQDASTACTPVTQTVTVTSATLPSAPTAASATICTGTTATLTATAPGGTYEWYSASSGGTLLATNSSYTTPTLTVSTTYYVQTTVSGCTSTRTAVPVTVSAVPATPTASGTSICSGNTATLTATAPGGTYDWYDAASGGTLLSTGASYTTPTLTVTTTYYVQTTVSGCASARRSVTVTVTATPAAPTASGTTICSGNTATLTATAPGGTYAWYDASSGGTLLVTNASYTTPTLTVTTTYYVQTTASGCTSPRTAVTVTVTPIPAAPTASGASICSGNTATLTATAPGGTYDWYTASSGGTLLVTNASYTTPTLTVTTTYYVQTTVSACTSPRTAVTVTVTATPAAPTASGTTICSGNTATLTATAPGGTYDWYTASSGGTLLVTNASYTTPTLTVTTTYYVQTTVSGCTSPRTAVTVTVTPLPAAPTASGTTICNGSATTLTATAPGGTYAWYSASSGGTLLVTNASYTTPALSSDTTFYVQTTVSGCTGPRTAVLVNVLPTPAPPSISGTTICQGQTATLTASSPSGIYEWYDAASGGTQLATTASYTTPTLTVTTTYYVHTATSGCKSTRVPATVTVTPTPAAPTASGTTICTGTTATLTATAPGGTYAWYDAASGGTLLVTNASYTTPTLTVTTTYYVQTTVSGCTGPRTAVTVTVSPVPAAPTATGTTICSGSTATLTATAPGGTYEWYTAASGGTLLVTNASYTTPTLTVTTTYYVQTTVAGCTGPRTAVTVTVNSIPATPTASGTTICSGNTATLTATAPGGTYEWYDASSGGTLLVTNASYTTPALTTTTSYYVQTTVAGCTSPRRTVTVTVTAVPAAPTAANATICEGSTVTLTATAPGGTYAWYDAASGGTLLVTNASYTTPTLTVTTTYYVQTTVSGCTSPRTAVTVTVNPTPAAPTASGTTICTGTTATLTATAPGGTYTWYDAASGGTLLVTNASYTTPTLTVTTTYYVQTTVSGCVGPRTAVAVTVNPIPAAPTAAGTTICDGTTATLTATAPGGTYTWYDAASGGTLLATNTSYTTPTLTVTTTYYVQTTVGGCTGARTAVTVTVSPVPAAPTASGTSICDGSTATLTATAPGGTYEWYSASSGGTLLATNASYTTPALSSTTTYYVQTTVAGCTNTNRTAVTVIVNPIPAAPAAPGTTICQSTSTTLTATAPGGTYAWYTAASGGTLLVTNASYTTPTLTVTTTYYVQTTVSGCTSPRTAVTVTVTPTPAAPTASGTTICDGSTATLTATAPGGTYAWYDAASGGTLLITNASYTTPALSSTTTYYVQTTVSGCAGPRTAVTVTVNPIPAAPTASGTTICTGTTATLTATAPGGTYAWYDAASGGTLLVTNASYTTPTLTVTTTYYVQATSLGCTGARTGVTVTVSPVPAAPTAANATICSGSTATLTATAPGGTYAWYSAASGGTLLITNASYTTPALSSTTTYYVQSTVAGCTNTNRTAVTVTVNPIPAAPTASGTTICTGTTATLTATAPGGTYDWYDAASGGTLLTTNASYTTPTLTVTTTYYVESTSLGCTGARTGVTVTVSPVPASPTAANATICDGSTATLTATAPGGTYAWYSAASGGTLLITNASYTTPALSSTTTYYVQTTVAGCTNTNRTAVTVTVNPIPAAPTASGTTICQSTSATLTATAPGGTYAWYTAASGGTLLVTNASYTTPTLTVTTTYYVQTTVTGCASATRTAVTVTVTPTPATPTASGTTICDGSTATLTATAPGGTYEWYDALSGGNLLTTGASYTTGALTANTTYYVQTTVSGCISARRSVTVVVNPIPVAPTAADATICDGSTATLTATAPGGTYKWYDAASGGTLLATNTSYTTPALSSTTHYYVQTTVGGCTSATRTDVTVTVNPIPAAPTASGTTICSGNTATVTATAPGGTYQWYTASTGGTLLATNASYTSPTLTVTTTYYVQTTVTGCTSPRTAVAITVTPIPATPTAAGTTICYGNTATLTATAPGGSYEWYDAASGGTLLASTAGYTTPALTATTTYYVQTTLSGCTSLMKAVTVTVTPTDDPSFNYSSGTYCISGSDPTPAITGGFTGTFSASPAGLVFLSTTTGEIDLSASTLNTYTVTYTTNGPCPDNSSVNITVTNTPSAVFSYTGPYCQGATNPLPSFNAGSSAGVFSSTAGLTFVSASTGELDLSASTPGTYTVTNTIAAAGGCAAASHSASVTINPAPTVSAGSSISICEGSTATLGGSIGGAAGSATWSGGTGAFTPNNTTLNAVYTPGVGETSAILTLTTNDPAGPCGSVSDTMIVTIHPIPAAPTASGTAICSGDSTTLTATAPGGTYKWYTATTGGTLLATNANYTTPTLTVTTTYYVQTTLSGCTSSSRTPVTVTVNSIPAAPTAAKDTICDGSTATLTATAPGGTYEWYDAATGGTLLVTNASYTTPPLSADATYYVQTTISGCTSNSRTPVTVTVNPIPAAPTAADATICNGSTVTLTATAPGGTYQWYNSLSGGTLLATGASYTTPALSAITTYYVQTTIGGCTSASRTPVTVNITPIPAAPTAAGTTICQGTSTTLTATAPGGTYEWYDASSGGTLLVTNANYTTPTLTVTTTYYVQTTVAGCTSPRTAVTVTITPTPATPTASGTTICNGSTATITATAPGGTYDWYTAASGGTLLTTNASYTTPTLTVTTTYYVQTTISGCTSLRKAVIVTVNPIPAIPTVANATICSGNTATLTATAPGGTYQWYDATSGGNLLFTGASYTTPVLAASATYYVQTTVSGCTSNSRKTVTVTVNPTPAAPTTAGASICQGNSTTLTATAPGGTYKWFTASTGGILIVTNASYTTPALAVTTTYYVQTTVSGCTSPRTTATVTVTPTDDPSFSYSSGTYCLTGSDPTPTITGGFPGTFSSSPAGLSLNTSNGTIDVSASTLGNYSVIYTTTGPCPASDTASITITNALNATFSYSGPYCQGGTNPSPTFGAGASAGVFSGTPGLVFISSATGTINLTSSAPGTYTVTNTIASSGGCAGTSSTASVTINPLATVNANVDQTICAGSTATLAGSVGGSATSGTWSGGTGSFSLATDLNAVYTPGVNETSATLTLTTNDPAGPCGSISDVVVITIRKDTSSFNYSSGTYCITGTNPTPVVNGGYTGTFSSSPAGLTFVNATTGEIDLGASTLSTYTVSFTTNGSCPDVSSATITITNSPDATFSYSSPYCQTQANPSPAFGGGASAGVFSATPAGLSFVSTSSGDIDLTTTTPGTYTVTNTIAAGGGCAAASHSATVTIDSVATVNAGASISICAGSTATLGGSVGGAATGGTWSGGTGTFSLATDLNAVYTPGIGETSAILTLTSNDPAGPCGAVSDTMMVIINPIPVAPTASGKTICAGSATTLNATAPGGTYKWYNAASGGTLLGTGANYTTPVLAGDATYYVQTTVAGCSSSSRTAVTVTVTPTPIVNAGIDKTVCSNNSNVILSGSVTNANGGKWTSSGSGTFVPSDSALSTTYIPSTTDTAAGSIYLVLASTGNGNCNTVIDSMLVTFSAKPVVNAGIDKSVCKSSITTSLNGTVTGGATTGKWTTTGTGTFTPNDTVLNATYTPSTADTSAGTVMLILTSTNYGGCNAVKDTLTLTYTDVPTVNAGSNQSVCANNTAVSLNGSSSTGTATWMTSGDGTFSPDATTLNATYTPGVNDTAAGTVILILNSTGGCTAVSKSITVTITDKPKVNANSDLFVCSNNLTATLNGIVSGGATTGKWTTTGSGSFVPNDTVLNATYTMTTADTTAGSIFMILTSTNNGNCNSVIDSMKITYTRSPVANAGNDLITCTNNSAQLNGSITGGSGTGIWTTTNGGGTFVPNATALNASYVPAAADTLTGIIKLVLTSTTSGGCSASTDTVIITVNPGPVVSAGIDKTVCANNANVTLSGSVSHATGGKWTSSGSGTFTPNDSTLSTTYVPSAADTTAGSIWLILTSKGNGSCTAVIDSMRVTFSPKPTVNAGADKSVCKSSITSTLSGSITGGSTTGKWTTLGSGTFSPNDTVVNATYTPSTADTTAGTVILVLTSTNNGGCNSVKDSITLTYTNIPVVNAGNNQTVCANNAAVSLSGSSSTGTGTWSSSGDGSFSPNATTLNATYTAGVNDTASGTVTLTLTSSGGCSTVSKNITVTITDAPVVTAGNDQSVCSGSLTLSLNGTISGGASKGKWTTTGTGTFTPNDSTLNATYTLTTADTAAGSVLLILTSTNNGNCNPVKDTVTVTYTRSPIAKAGNDLTGCANNPASLNGTVSGGSGTGIWTTPNGSGTFLPNNTTLNASYTPSSADTLAGNILLILTSTNNGGCAASVDTAIITVNPGPVVSAGIDKTVCANNANVSLSGTVANASGGKWTSSGSGTFSPSDSVLSTMYIPSTADTTAGSVYLILTSTGNGSCTTVIDSMLVTFSPKPVINAGADLSVCKSSITSSLNGSVTGGATTGKWTTLGSGTFSPNDTVLNATYTPGTADTTAGTVKLVLTSTNNGGCNAVTDTITITYTNIPTVNAGSDQTVCANNAIVSLSGSSSTGTATWSTSGDGTFAPDATTLNATYTPGVNDTTAGTVTLTLTSSGGCVPVTKTITITITDAPVISAGSDLFVCANNLTATLNGTVSGGAVKGKWTSTGTGTFVPNDSTLNATYTMTTADTTAGSVILILTSSSNGNCAIVKDSVTLAFTTSPLANAGSDMITCTNSAGQLNGTITGGSGTGTWTTTNGTGTFVPNNTTLNASYVPGNADTLTGNIVLVLTSGSAGGCGVSTDTVIITVKPGPTVTAGPDQTLCSNNVTGINLSGAVTVASGGKWTTSGTGTFSPTDSTLNATYTPSAADLTTGVNIVLTSKGNGQCQAVTDTVKISFSPAPLVNASTDIFICSGTMTASLNGSVTGGSTTGKWTTTGTGTFTPTDSTLNATYNLSTADTAAGTVTLILTSTNNGNCVAVIDTVVVTITSVPVMYAGADSTICANTNIQLNGTVTGGSGTGLWTTKGSGTFSPTDSTLNATYTPSAADTTAGSVMLIFTATNSCLATADTMILSFSPVPTVNANVDQNICQGNIVTLNGSFNNVTGAQWSTTGTGTFNPNATTPNATYTPSAADIASGTIKLVLTTTGNGSCTAVADSMIITIQPKPAANFTSNTACLNTTVNFTDASTGGVTTWAWDFGNGTSVSQNPANIFTSTGSKTITLIVTNSGSCADTVTRNIVVNALPVAAFTTLSFCPDSAEFTDASTMSPGTISSWSWNFGDSTFSTLRDPRHTYASAGTYIATLLVISDSGCVATATDSVTVIDCDDGIEVVHQPVVPSAFTPNGDGHNDILFVKGGPFTTLSFRVFNEWGNEIFSSADQGKGWDGTFNSKAQPAGSYVWTVIGTTTDNKEVKLVGGVTLIR